MRKPESLRVQKSGGGGHGGTVALMIEGQPTSAKHEEHHKSYYLMSIERASKMIDQLEFGIAQATRKSHEL